MSTAISDYAAHQANRKAEVRPMNDLLETCSKELSVKAISGALTKAEFRNLIQKMEEAIIGKEGSISGDVCFDAFPPKHSFGDGLYIRETSVPAGLFVASKIHKFTHPYFVIKGRASVFTEDGVVEMKAGHHGITKAGTKRILLIHEDTTWATVHRTDKTNVEEILEEITANSFDEFDIFSGIKEVETCQ